MRFKALRAGLIKHLSTEISDKRVLVAMGHIPRERFVPFDEQAAAYADRPIHIGLEQTISQPLIVAMMTEALELKITDKVLEVGTGSGYQAAILAELASSVITTERLPELAQKAQNVLINQGYTNITVHQAEETLGWRGEAPYDAIMVTAGAPDIPLDLIAQLAIGGRMVIPVGSRYIQELFKLTKRDKKNIIENLGGCRFVSLIGKDAWEEEQRS